MKPVSLLTILLTALITTFSCKDGITTIEEPQPGRRDYVWKRDTLRADMEGWQHLHGIWGDSPKDIWVIGDAYTYVNKVWHYDGVNWKNYLLNEYAEPTKIWGVSSSEIWMLTKQSEIWKYNGTKWYKHTTIVPPGYSHILFQDIFGYTNSIYAVGVAVKSDGDYTGIIVHYNGVKWEIVKTPLIKEYFFNVIFVNGGDVLISGQDFHEPNQSCRLYVLKNGTLNLIGKNRFTYFLGVLNKKCYISVDAKVYEYVNGVLVEHLTLPKSIYAGGIIGRSLKDFFCANSGWYLGHYNGTSLDNLYFVNASIANGFVFEKEVFFILNNQGSTILHGKLN
ncbi:MAG: hypothetical protein FD143_1855 [Ignavibacteria bacterium]|nr:MAG: hypothetical protein FD143_1855 [Ignavibacteria bacterium]KAF0157699.1 MAG: hypothetical protein FD188_2678 [Ignavibacteria bacterium]